MNSSDILNKGCDIKAMGSEYYCYNTTENLMHFIKRGNKGQLLSLKNKNNFLNMSKGQVLRMVELGSVEVTVGTISV